MRVGHATETLSRPASGGSLLYCCTAVGQQDAYLVSFSLPYRRLFPVEQVSDRASCYCDFSSNESGLKARRDSCCDLEQSSCEMPCNMHLQEPL